MVSRSSALQQAPRLADRRDRARALLLFPNSLKPLCCLKSKGPSTSECSATLIESVCQRFVPHSPVCVSLWAAPRRAGWSSPWWWRCSSSWGCSPDLTTSSSSSCSTPLKAQLEEEETWKGTRGLVQRLEELLLQIASEGADASCSGGGCHVSPQRAADRGNRGWKGGVGNNTLEYC